MPDAGRNPPANESALRRRSSPVSPDGSPPSPVARVRQREPPPVPLPPVRRGSAPEESGPAGDAVTKRCAVQCLHELREAEVALGRARAALAQMGVTADFYETKPRRSSEVLVPSAGEGLGGLPSKGAPGNGYTNGIHLGGGGQGSMHADTNGLQRPGVGGYPRDTKDTHVPGVLSTSSIEDVSSPGEVEDIPGCVGGGGRRPTPIQTRDPDSTGSIRNSRSVQPSRSREAFTSEVDRGSNRTSRSVQPSRMREAFTSEADRGLPAVRRSVRRSNPGVLAPVNFKGPILDQVIVASIEFSMSGGGEWLSGPSATKSFLTHSPKSGSSSRNKRGSASGTLMEITPSMVEKFEQVSTRLSEDVIWQPILQGWVKLPMVHPEAIFRMAWTLIGCLFIAYEVFAIPVYLAFDYRPEGFFYICANMITAYFLVDILTQFFIGHFDKMGNVIVAPSKVVKRYAQTWLVPDLIASIPWEWLVNDDDSRTKTTRSLKLVRGLRAVRIIRLLRIAKIGPYMQRLEAVVEANQYCWFFLGLLRVMVMLAVVCHWSACSWYAIGVMNIGMAYPDGDPASWVDFYQGAYPYISGFKSEQYTYALYYCLTTMTTVGYGDITCRHIDEVRFTIFLLVMSGVCFASLMGNLTNLLATLQAGKKVLSEKRGALSRYMQFRKVPWKLMMSIRQHLLFVWEANEGYEEYEEDLLSRQLSPVLKAELLQHIYGKLLKSAPFLAWMQDYPVCTRYLAQKIVSLFLSAQDELFRMGQVNESIYTLIHGIVGVSRVDKFFEEEAQCKKVKRGLLLDDDDAVILDLSAYFEEKQQHERKTDIQKCTSEVLERARIELLRHDIQRRVAARKLQKIWRSKGSLLRNVIIAAAHSGSNPSASKLLAGTTPGPLTRASGSSSADEAFMSRRRKVKAPAYFGEGCLWQPIEDWGKSPVTDAITIVTDVLANPGMPQKWRDARAVALMGPATACARIKSSLELRGWWEGRWIADMNLWADLLDDFLDLKKAPIPRYLYTVRCETKCELACIPRAAIKDLLDRFSPWLPRRFEVFQDAVNVQFDNLCKRNDRFRRRAQHWCTLPE